MIRMDIKDAKIWNTQISASSRTELFVNKQQLKMDVKDVKEVVRKYTELNLPPASCR